MIKATTTILSEENIELLDKIGIDYYVLKNSKANELAFATDNHKKREFEIRFMSDSTYRIATRFIGYRDTFKSLGKEITKANDPDGRRYSFYVIAKDTNEVNQIINQMLNTGYDPKPKIENI